MISSKSSLAKIDKTFENVRLQILLLCIVTNGFVIEEMMIDGEKSSLFFYFINIITSMQVSCYWVEWSVMNDIPTDVLCKNVNFLSQK